MSDGGDLARDLYGTICSPCARQEASAARSLGEGKLLARLWGALQVGIRRTEVERWLKSVGKKDWNVRLQERYAHGRGVMVCLSRYVKGGPISDRRIVQADEAQTRFRYKDHRDGKTKVMAVSTAHFMERVL